MLDETLKNINRQLEKRHLKAKTTEKAIFNATIIESAAAPHKIINTIPLDREEKSNIAVYKIWDIQLSADKNAQ